MNNFRFIWKSALYNKWQNLLLITGTVISIAVLTGALITGSSVKYSLERIVTVRLGEITNALQGNVFFRDSLADEFSKKCQCKTASLIRTEGVAVNNLKRKKISGVNIYGIDQLFSSFWNDTLNIKNDEAAISENVAEKLAVHTGDEIVLRINKPDPGLADAPFLAETSPGVSATFKIKTIASGDGYGRFSLKESQVAPLNIFISRDRLSQLIKEKGKSNILITSLKNNPDSVLKKIWRLEDTGYSFSEKQNAIRLSSEKLFIPDDIAEKVIRNAGSGESYLSWLVNEISSGNGTTPYSFVTATDHLFSFGRLKSDEILLSDWLADDLHVKRGDRLLLKFYTIRNGRNLSQEKASFVVKEIIPLSDPVFDKDLMPEFPGISDAVNCRDWQTETPVDLKKIRKKDEDYWKKFKGTPKAFISLEKGHKIWENPYGILTLIKFPAGEYGSDEISIKTARQTDPARAGLAFDPVYEKGTNAARNSTDFAGLFLGLGIFIIISGILLSVMLYSLQLSFRSHEINLLDSLGFSRGGIFRIIFSEMLLIVFIGGIAGAFTGIYYTKLIIRGLSSVWIPATGTSDLILHYNVSDIVFGTLSGVFFTMLFLIWILRNKIRNGRSNRNKILIKTRNFTFPEIKTIIIRNFRSKLIRNCGIISLFATAVFIIAITGINSRGRQNGNFRNSGTGGFSAWGDATAVLPRSLFDKPQNFGLDSIKLIPVRQVERSDASCLNLNQVSAPNLAGVPPDAFLDRFSFIRGEKSWKSLDKEISHNLIPGIIDETVLQWGIRKKIGDTVFYRTGNGDSVGVKILSTLENSVFQGFLIISDSLMGKYFPSSNTTKILLAEDGRKKDQQVATLLEENLSDYGIHATTANARLEAFDAVQNTYLSVFSVLGGLGILISTIGFAVFFLKDLLSQKKELAVYRAMGLSEMTIFKISTGASFMIITIGIASGLVVSVLVIPLLSINADISAIINPLILVICVFLNSFIWITLVTLVILKRNILNSLRLE